LKFLLHPTYFPNIATCAVMAQKDVIWEVHDNYQKQTFRNRTYICTDRGRLMLNIPIQHVGGEQGRQKYQDVKLKNEYAWQRQHLKTLQTAYRTSPFFEFYEDELIPFFGRQFNYLLDMNFESLKLIADIIGLELPPEKTSSFEITVKNTNDVRYLVNAKENLKWGQGPYTQVFQERHGFIQNTSILDLLFNEGPNTLSYLKNQNTNFLDTH